jgi:hypothetical protein
MPYLLVRLLSVHRSASLLHRRTAALRGRRLRRLPWGGLYPLWLVYWFMSK